MIVDANETESGRRVEADLCIVGAGAAGIALALQFEHRAEKLVVLESGGWRAEAATQALYEGYVAPASAHPPLTRYRRRAFGGSTGIWGGRCVPFDPIDFETRDWMPGTAWPFRFGTLLPYYRRAARLCEAGDFAFTVDAAFPRGMRAPLPGFHGRRFTDAQIERFSCPTDFARRYGRRLKAAGNIIVMLHANVVKLATRVDGNSVETAQVETLKGRHFKVRARHFVLAAGGLEVPRLLLASRDTHALGLGNAYDQVGRHYMTHVAGTIGDVIPMNGKLPFLDYERSDDGVYCRRRFALTEAAQRELRTGNFIARLHHPRLRDPAHGTGTLSAVYLAKPFISHEYASRLSGVGRLPINGLFGHLRNVALDLPAVTAFAVGWLVWRKLAARKFPSLVVHPRSGVYSLDFHAEQVPNPDSRVTITRERDRLGVPKLQVDWRLSAADLRTVRLSLAALEADFSESGCATLRYDPAEIIDAAQRDGAYGGHHIGTARMSASPRAGVVDEACRVHGVRNLFIAGSAVFPTSSQANPTLTVVAMALRLADTLKATVCEDVTVDGPGRESDG
jgi:choline dehydrogenase-like flavoprotein